MRSFMSKGKNRVGQCWRCCGQNQFAFSCCCFFGAQWRWQCPMARDTYCCCYFIRLDKTQEKKQHQSSICHCECADLVSAHFNFSVLFTCSDTWVQSFCSISYHFSTFLWSSIVTGAVDVLTSVNNTDILSTLMSAFAWTHILLLSSSFSSL